MNVVLYLSCLVGEDFWYMGQRCDVRMTRARLIGVCLAILLIIVTVIGVLAFVAVRRYRAILIQAKVDQTRSRYTLTHAHTHRITAHNFKHKEGNHMHIAGVLYKRPTFTCRHCSNIKVQ